MAIAARYDGTGFFLQGIPARDLSTDEWAALSDDDRQRARASGLYRVGKRADAAEGAAETPAPEVAETATPKNGG